MALTSLSFRPAYDPDVCGDPVGEFYAPALGESVAYDRDTFTFTANGLAAAAVGLAGLLRNDGRVRIICEPRELSEEVRQAIIDGYTQALLEAVPPQDLTRTTAEDIRAKSQLEIITWLVAQGRLEIRVALPRRAGQGIFHSKTGIMTDAEGNRVSFDGSPNETDAGWGRNYERFHVFKSWQDPERVQVDVEHFARLWENRSGSVYVRPIPEAYIEHFRAMAPRQAPAPRQWATADARAAYWRRIREAVRADPGVTTATAPARLWPHQEAFFRRHAYGEGPDRLLIADEVGLGKTIQAGSLVKARINQGRVSRLLILAPKPACRQWQDELQRKFNLGIPVLDTGGRPTLVYPDGTAADAPRPAWAADLLIASYQWLRYHKDAFLDSGRRYDMVVVDEAHRARFLDVANANRRRPNRYLELLRELAKRTEGLLLLTATPMQLHEAELVGLLELLRPIGWTAEDFRRFYDADGPPDAARWRFMADIYREHSPDPAARDEALIHSRNTVYVDQRLTPEIMAETARLMRERSPARRLMSRHTRETLRRYAREGRIRAVVPDRRVHPVAIEMNDGERRLYAEIDALVGEVYAGAPGVNATALGFVMTTYRKRLGSSPRAFARTCRNHLERRLERGASAVAAWREYARLSDDELDDDPDAPLPGTTLTAAAMARLERAARDAAGLESRDTKLGELRRQLDGLVAEGHRKIMIFTQFRDTMLYLTERLSGLGYGDIAQLSGQDDPALGRRVQRIRAMRDAARGLLICTETASESLNLQFCSAMVNYDIPWNPMTLEQRIGRIDRIGQERAAVEIVNLFYADTAEWHAYEAMLERLRDIHANVGDYQPILYDPGSANRLAAIIRDNGDRQATRAAVHNIARDAGLNLDALNSTPEPAAAPAAAIGMADLQLALTEPGLLPDGWFAAHQGGPHWQVMRPDGGSRPVTTDADAYEYDGAGAEWFGPGSPWWPG